MRQSSFEREFRLVRGLVWLQRAARLALRATWAAVAGYLAVWSANAMWGWFPDPRAAWAGAALAAVGLVLPAFARRLGPEHVAWALDRRLGLQERISAALEVQASGAPSVLGRMLVAESGNELAQVRRRLARAGWFIGPELQAALAMALLLGAMLLAESAGAPAPLPDLRPLTPAPLRAEPRAGEIFPAGLPGLEPVLSREAAPADSQPARLVPDRSGGDALADPLSDALRRLGEQLSEGAATYEVGQDLQAGDLEAAARSLDALADQLEALPEGALRELADALERASDLASQAAGQGLAEALDSAADSMRDGDALGAQESLDQAAGELRDLAEQERARLAEGDQGEESAPGGAAGGTGLGRRGEPEPVARLLGEGEALDLSGEGGLPGILGAPDAELQVGTAAVGGVFNALDAGESQVISSVLTPYRYSWKWRDVVATYFSP